MRKTQILGKIFRIALSLVIIWVMVGGIGSASPLTYTIYATREGLVGGTTANGHVIQSHDHFVALPSAKVLSSLGGHEFEVRLTYNGRSVVAPVWDLGPWNTKDDYWSLPSDRQMWQDLPQGKPESQAAYLEGYNGGFDQTNYLIKTSTGSDVVNIGDRVQPTGNGLKVRALPGGNEVGSVLTSDRGTITDGPERSVYNNLYYRWWKITWDNGLIGWSAQKRYVSNPAGIDLADGTFWDDLGMTTNDWVTVEYLWTNNLPKFQIGDRVQVTYNLNVRTGPGISYPEISDPDYHGNAPLGSIGKIIDAPSSADGYIWWKVDYGDIEGSFAGWSIEDELRKVTGEPVISSSLAMTQSPPYFVGNTITAIFTITNKMDYPITFDVLTVGGLDPDNAVSDFVWRQSITLNPSESYNYQGTITPTKIGNYHFFCAYRELDGSWNTGIPTNSGVTNTFDISVIQKNPPTAYIDSITPNPANEGQTVTFSGHGSDPDVADSITAYNWRSSINGQLSTSNSFSSSTLSAGTHTIYFKVMDSHSTWSPEVTRTLTVTSVHNQLPIPDFSFSPENPVINDKITFDASSSIDPDGGPLKFKWCFDSNPCTTLSSNPVIEYQYQASGVHTVILLVTDDEGESNWTSKEISITDSWKFAVITDLHIGREYPDYAADIDWNFNSYGNPQFNEKGYDDIGAEGREYYLTERLRRVVQWLNNHHESESIKFLVVLGDISERGEYSEMKKAKDILNDLDIPYFTIIGNHDSCGKIADKNEYLSENYNMVFNDTFLETQKNRLDQNIIIQKDNDLQLTNYAFTYRGINLVFLDFIPRDKCNFIPSLHDKTLEFLTQQLNDPNNKPSILFSHHPMVSPYSFLLGFYKITDIIQNSDSKVLANFGGHIHNYYNHEPNSMIDYPNTISDANKDYSQSADIVPVNNNGNRIPVVTTEALLVADNELGDTSKNIIRIVDMKGQSIKDYNTIMGSFYTLNPSFYVEMNHFNFGNIIHVKFLTHAFTKWITSDKQAVFSMDFGDEQSQTIQTDDNDVHFEHDYVKVEGRKNYDVTLQIMPVGNPGMAEKITQRIHVPYCDFSNQDGVERCFGGIGRGCDGVPVVASFTKDPETCEVQGWMSVGSIRHDQCCRDSDNKGYMCNFNYGLKCQNEWDEAYADTSCTVIKAPRQWSVTFGPYPIGNTGDFGDVPQASLKAPAGTRVKPSNVDYCASGKCKTDGMGNIKIQKDGCGDYCECANINVPEFPSIFLPVTMIIGFLGAVLLIQKTREN